MKEEFLRGKERKGAVNVLPFAAVACFKERRGAAGRRMGLGAAAAPLGSSMARETSSLGRQRQAVPLQGGGRTSPLWDE